MGKTFSFVSGALFGAAAGAIIGVALAPRSGAETRAMAADIANDAWGLSLSGIHIDKKLAKEEAKTILEGYTEIPLERLPTGEFPEDK